MGHPKLDYYQWTGFYEQSADSEDKGNSKRQIYTHVFRSEVRVFRVPSWLYLYTVGRAPSGVVSNRAGRVSPIIGTAAARKIDVRFFCVIQLLL